MSQLIKKPKNISAFLHKTYTMLQDSSNQAVIVWANNRVGFIILNQEALTHKVLPKYFKHSNFSSFIRQLNMYDFHKIRKGNLENYFYHDKFIRDDLKSISQIKRKPQKKKLQKSQYIHQQPNICIKPSVIRNFNKTQITLNSVHTIKHKSEASIAVIKENNFPKHEAIYYQEYESNSEKSYLHIGQGNYEYDEDIQVENDSDSSKMSINNQIQSKYVESKAKQIMIPSHNNIFQFVNHYQLANFGLFM